MWTIFDNIKYLYGVNAYNNEDVAYFVREDTLTKEEYSIITGEDCPEES